MTRKSSNNKNVWGWLLDEADEQLGETCVGSCNSSMATVRNDDSDQTIDSMAMDDDVGSTTSFTTSGYSSDAMRSRELKIQEAHNELQRQILLQEQRLLQQNEEHRADDSSEDLQNVGVTDSGSYYFTALNDIDESLRGCNKSANNKAKVGGQAHKQQVRNENITAHRDDTTHTQRQESSIRVIAPDDIETGMHCGVGLCAGTNIPKEKDEIVNVTKGRTEFTTILLSDDDSDNDLNESIEFDPMQSSEFNEHNNKTNQGRRRLGSVWYILIVVIVVAVGIAVGILLIPSKSQNETNLIAPSTPTNSSSIPYEPITPRFEPEPTSSTDETHEFSDDLQLDDGAFDFHDDLLNAHMDAFQKWQESQKSEFDDDDTDTTNGDIDFGEDQEKMDDDLLQRFESNVQVPP